MPPLACALKIGFQAVETLSTQNLFDGAADKVLRTLPVPGRTGLVDELVAKLRSEVDDQSRQIVGDQPQVRFAVLQFLGGCGNRGLQGLLGQLLLGDVGPQADDAARRSIGAALQLQPVAHPAIGPVRVPQPILLLEVVSVEQLREFVASPMPVVRMDYCLQKSGIFGEGLRSMAG